MTQAAATGRHQHEPSQGKMICLMKCYMSRSGVQPQVQTFLAQTPGKPHAEAIKPSLNFTTISKTKQPWLFIYYIIYYLEIYTTNAPSERNVMPLSLCLLLS